MTLNCNFLAFLVLSEQGIYVSRFTGHNTKTCGHVSSPCRTVSYGIQQLSTGLYIYLDGTDTLKNPYPCETLDPRNSAINLKKNVSFVSIKSRAHISCRHSNYWLGNGLGHKHGIRISFFGMTFLNTSLEFFDAFVAADDVVFAKTKTATLRIFVAQLPRVDLSLSNVAFENNAACIEMDGSKGQTFVKITNTIFYQNGDPFLSRHSILSLASRSFSSLVIVQLRNCSFEKNTFARGGMISVENVLGATNVFLKQIKLKENRQMYPSTNMYSNICLFCFKSWRFFLRLEHGFIYKTSGTFVNVMTGQLAKIYISNTEVDEFFSDSPGGGVVNVKRRDSCYLSTKDSSLRNGNNYGAVGILSL